MNDDDGDSDDCMSFSIELWLIDNEPPSKRNTAQ